MKNLNFLGDKQKTDHKKFSLPSRWISHDRKLCVRVCDFGGDAADKVSEKLVVP